MIFSKHKFSKHNQAFWIYRIFGRVIATKIHTQLNPSLHKKTQQCLFLKTLKIINHKFIHYLAKIELFGLKFALIDDGKKRAYFICGKKIFYHQSAIKLLWKRHFRNYDAVFIMQCNSGEIFSFLLYFYIPLIKKLRAKNPLILATQSYHIDILKIILPLDLSKINALDLNLDLKFNVNLDSKFNSTLTPPPICPINLINL